MTNVFITGAVRTAIGSFGGSLAGISATDLGAVVVREAMVRAGIDPADVDEGFMGHVIQAGCGLNPARQVMLKAGVPHAVPACTINKVCASGMKAISLAALSIASGENEIVVAGGMENMSQAPFLLPNARWGYRLGNGEVSDSIQTDALIDPLGCFHMASTSENLAEEFHITRSEQDVFAACSQAKAAAAQKANKFNREIVPVKVPQKRGDPVLFVDDEFIKPNTTVDVLTKLRPAFQKDGTVTAGNASGINDGAAALVLCSESETEKRGMTPMARIVGYTSVGVEPERMGFGPVSATQKVMAKTGLSLQDIEIIELNEAFAGQSLAVIKALELDPSKININGGAIALGHPVGASGARIVVTLLHLLEDRQARYGLATLCVGGGQGMAMIVERQN